MTFDFKLTKYQKTRGCYFDDEIKLSYYKRYNQENCYRECVADYIKAECQCTLLSLPSMWIQNLSQMPILKTTSSIRKLLFIFVC
jgi:hypothetical protein